ncbi:hypothetical protein MUN82_08785 [Hymenobacter aerilatus]|uniref:Uncharacterized protein n=1 Tax=Hymenobacter aerilatus TaxID=2932251 RepID=A0A8T9SYM5_9BACT|nr:hypothetical protein [Hymenobacter aerilatus]UOR07178.1 hypothetical protein MUN82_08785 [Hymenobacter aerilatus]
MAKDPRKDRLYNLTFDSAEEKAFYIEYAQRVHGLKLAQWLKKMMRDDRRQNDSKS